MPTPQKPRRMPESYLRQRIAAVARDFSRLRKAERLLEHSYLDEAVPSNADAMQADWRHAVIQWIDWLMTRSVNLGDLNAECYWHFEGIWIDQIKQHRAYCYWTQARSEGDYWTPPDNRDRHYFMACEDMRDLLVNPGCKEPAETFSEPQRYIREKYLTDGGTAHGPRIDWLIDSKAHRLRQKMSYDAAHQCAAKFVATFYENIIPAAVEKSRPASIKVLQSLQHSGSPANAPDIVNGFETLLAVLYLDLAMIQDLWESGEVIREAIF